MTQIEKHSKIAVGLRKGIEKQRPAPKTTAEETPMEQLDIFGE